jgi:hypothetical protein
VVASPGASCEMVLIGDAPCAGDLAGRFVALSIGTSCEDAMKGVVARRGLPSLAWPGLATDAIDPTLLPGRAQQNLVQTGVEDEVEGMGPGHTLPMKRHGLRHRD